MFVEKAIIKVKGKKYFYMEYQVSVQSSLSRNKASTRLFQENKTRGGIYFGKIPIHLFSSKEIFLVASSLTCAICIVVSFQ